MLTTLLIAASLAGPGYDSRALPTAPCVSRVARGLDYAVCANGLFVGVRGTNLYYHMSAAHMLYSATVQQGDDSRLGA